jgi:N-acetylglucosaminyldiphosphoundecaprenol N-acetyl-beta-D-mannosaminyltransferase
VGAAFDLHAGVKSMAPLWMQRRGLEWLYRLVQEPGRLWKRYLVNNSVFVWLCLGQAVRKVTGSGAKREVEPAGRTVDDEPMAAAGDH